MTDPITQKRSHSERFGSTRYFVPDETTKWFTRVFGGCVFAIGALFGAVSWWYHQEILNAAGFPELMGWGAFVEVVEYHSRQSLIISAASTLASTFFVLVVSLFLFHRILGPIYRLKKHMQSIIDGAEPSELSFRKHDQLQNVAATFNQLLHSLDVLEPKSLAESSPEGVTRRGSL